MKYYIFFIAFIFSSIYINAQELTGQGSLDQQPKDYVIFTFELDVKGKTFDKKDLWSDHSTFYWITEVDSITSPNFPICPLDLEGSPCTDMELRRGIDRDTVVWKFHFVEDESTLIDSMTIYNSTIEQLINLNNRHRRKVQEYNTKWFNDEFDPSETITVYALPVRGYFIDSKKVLFKTNSNVHGADDSVYFSVPNTKYKYISKFWRTRKRSCVELTNYLFVDFTGYNPFRTQNEEILRGYSPRETWK